MTLLELAKQSLKWVGIWLAVLVGAVAASVCGLISLLGILDMIGKN